MSLRTWGVLRNNGLVNAPPNNRNSRNHTVISSHRVAWTRANMASSAHDRRTSQQTANSVDPLTPDIICKVAEQLPPNDVACGLKLASQVLAAPLRGLYRTVHLQHPTNPDLPCEPWPGPHFVSHWGRPEPWRALTLRQRRRVLGLAAASGDAASLDIALAHCGASAGEAVVPPAAAGSIPALERLLQLPGGRDCVFEAACAAAGAGQLHVLQWLHRRPDYRAALDNVVSRRCVMEAAARGRQDAVIEWLLQQDLVTCQNKDARTWVMVAAALGCKPVLSRAFPAMLRWHHRHTSVLPSFVYGCTLSELQQHFDAIVDTPEELYQLPLGLYVSVAAASPASDWLQRVEYLEQRWAAATAGRRGTADDDNYHQKRLRSPWLHITVSSETYTTLKTPPDYIQRLEVRVCRPIAHIDTCPSPLSTCLGAHGWLIIRGPWKPRVQSRVRHCPDIYLACLVCLQPVPAMRSAVGKMPSNVCTMQRRPLVATCAASACLARVALRF